MRSEAIVALLEARRTSSGAAARFLFAGTSPIFAGHFPGNPVVPGVLLFAATLAALDSVEGGPRLLVAVDDAKFMAPVPPDQVCEVEVEVSPEVGALCRCEARWRIDDVMVARLRLAFR